jgi:hypothetical protein
VSGLNDLIVVMPLGELGYQRYWQMLMTHRDFGYMIFTRRIVTHSGSYTHASPNLLIKEALDPEKTPMKWKRMLILEHDHEFPLGFLRKHAAYTEPIVASTYVLRDATNPLPVVYNWDAQRANALQPTAGQVKHMLDHPGLHEADVVPMGCTSIRRDVLENWPEGQPYFSSFTNAALSTITHDVFFCRVAQDHGWQPMIDTSLQVKHYTLVPLDIPYFIGWYNSIGEKLIVEAAEKKAATRGVGFVPPKALELVK